MPTLFKVPATINSFDSKQVAYPVGPNNDCYYINCWYTVDTTTNIITIKYQVVKNQLSRNRETLYEDTNVIKCLEIVEKIVNAEGGVITEAERYPEMYSKTVI